MANACLSYCPPEIWWFMHCESQWSTSKMGCDDQTHNIPHNTVLLWVVWWLRVNHWQDCHGLAEGIHHIRIQINLKIQNDMSEVDGKKGQILILSQFLWYNGVKLGVGDFIKESEYCKHSFTKEIMRQWLCSVEEPVFKVHWIGTNEGYTHACMKDGIRNTMFRHSVG